MAQRTNTVYFRSRSTKQTRDHRFCHRKLTYEICSQKTDPSPRRSTSPVRMAIHCREKCEWIASGYWVCKRIRSRSVRFASDRASGEVKLYVLCGCAGLKPSAGGTGRPRPAEAGTRRSGAAGMSPLCREPRSPALCLCHSRAHARDQADHVGNRCRIPSLPPDRRYTMRGVRR